MPTTRDPDGDFQNDEFQIATAGTEIEIRFVKEADIGTDTSTLRYMSFQNRSYASHLVIRSDMALSITEINGKTPKAGISMVGDKSISIKGSMKINKFKILTGEASSNIKILAF